MFGGAMDLPIDVKKKILSAKGIAIWPVDENPLSESFRTALYFQDMGLRVYPINDYCEKLGSEPCFRDLRLIPDDYDILLLFVQPANLPNAVNAIFNADYVPPVVWTHRGIFDQASFDRLNEAGIITVMDEDIVELFEKWIDEVER